MLSRDVRIGMLVRFPMGRGIRAVGKVVHQDRDERNVYRFHVEVSAGEDGPIIKHFKSSQLHPASQPQVTA